MGIRYFAAAALCALVPSVTAAQDLVPFRQKVLDNGVTVIVWERPSAGRVGTRMFYRVDVAAERPGTVGLTHMLEHFLFKGSDLAGTTDWEAEKAIAERIEVLERRISDEKNRHRDCFRQRDVFADVERDCDTPRLRALQAELGRAIEAQDRLSDPTWYDWAVQGAGGTNSTASTGMDWMKFDIDLPASKLELFMWTERARVERPVFRQFEAEREVVVNQIRGGDNRPDGRFDRMLRSMTYEASPYGWSHWFSDLTRATREDHWEIFHKYFIPQNAIIVVVGEVEADEVFRMADAYWGSWQPGRPSPRLRTVEPPPVGERRLTVSAAAGPRVAINVPMPAAGHPDAPVFQVLGEALSGEDGLLAKELIADRGLATSARASGSPAKYRSHFSVRVDVRGNDDIPAVEAGIETVLRRVRDGGVTEPELDAAAGRLALALARNLEEIGNAAVTIGAMESIHHAGYINELPRLWRAVTVKDLARLVATYFAADMRTVGILKRDAGPVVSIAEAGPPTAPDPDVAGKPAGPPRGPAAPPRPALNDGTPRPTPRRRARSPCRRRRRSPSRSPSPSSPGMPPMAGPRRPSSFASPARRSGTQSCDSPTRRSRPRTPRRSSTACPTDCARSSCRKPCCRWRRSTLLVDAPALDDPAGKEGLAGLLASILRRTGTSKRSRVQLEQAFARLNATLTVTADANATRLHIVSPPETAVEALRLLGELVTIPDLESAVRGRTGPPGDRSGSCGRFAHVPGASAVRSRAHGPAHPAARRPSAASVGAIALDDVRHLHQARYRAPHMALAISGRIERPGRRSGARVRVWRPEAAGDRGRPTGCRTADGHARGARRRHADLDIRQAHVHIGHAGIVGVPEDHAALEVMNYILSGGGFVSRMMKLLRTDTGITSALYGSVEPGRRYDNPYLWRFTGAPETIARGVRLALEQIAIMHEQGVTEEEFQAARTAYLDGLVPASYETAHLVATRLATKALFGLYDYQSPQYLNYYAGDGSSSRRCGRSRGRT
jgi:predicted Zn-dependent peptidase